MKRLGIFGGTFDPPHIGHLIIAQTALCELHLDKVLFIPCGNPPHKSAGQITDAVHRLAMIQELVRTNDRFEVSDMEVVNDAPSYTAVTVKRLHEQMPDAELTFIVGADSLAYMKDWWHPEEIFSRCSIAVAARSSVLKDELRQAAAECERLYQAKIRILNMPMIDISSTEIRSSDNLDRFRYLIPDAVIEYIKLHKLFGLT